MDKQARPKFKKKLAPVTLSREAEAKAQSIRTKLREIKGYKEILRQEGLQPDAADKHRESELIIQLLRIEKGLPPKAKPKPRPNKKH